MAQAIDAVEVVVRAVHERITTNGMLDFATKPRRAEQVARDLR
jgi:hypothetical protein